MRAGATLNVAIRLQRHDLGLLGGADLVVFDSWRNWWPAKSTRRALARAGNLLTPIAPAAGVTPPRDTLQIAPPRR